MLVLKKGETAWYRGLFAGGENRGAAHPRRLRAQRGQGYHEGR
jgi:hypothetical protein